MKGSEVFSDLFFIFVIIAVSLVFTAFLWAVTVVYTVAGPNTRYVTLNLVDYPIQNDGALMAFMECTYDGTPMKTLVTQAILQGKTTISYNGVDNIDVKKASEDILPSMFSEGEFMLTSKNPELTIAQSGEMPKNLNKISMKIPVPDGESTLELYVGV